MTKAERIYKDIRRMCENHIKEHGYTDGDKFHHRGFDEYQMCVRTCNAVMEIAKKEDENIARSAKLGVYDEEKKELRINTNKMVKSTVEGIRMYL
jgi:hypothetical protein